MKKTLFVLLFFAFNSSAWASWIYVVTSGDDADIFIDTATIKRTGDNRRVWELLNLNKAFEGGMSMRFLTIYDCRNERYQRLNWSIHLEPMAQGKVLGTGNYEKPEWEYIAPRTAGSDVLKFVCALNNSK
jgi:hypothetical protein